MLAQKFTLVLTTFFNTIIDSWPTIEPMLMRLVDLLADGLSQAIPILGQLGGQLLPVFCAALALIFQVIATADPCDRKSGRDAAPAGVDPVHAGGCAVAPIDHDPERRVQ